MKHYAVLVVAAIMVIAGLGCAALSQLVTPAVVDRAAVHYVNEAGVADANDFRGFANLDKALRLQMKVDSAYEIRSLAIRQMAEKNELDYRQLKGVAAANAEVAQLREEQLFGEKGLLSMGLGLLGVGAFTGTLGLMRRRPGDFTQADVETALAELKGEVTDKDRQFLEVVRGVQAYLDVHPKGDAAGDELRQNLQKQSLDTREAVAVAKTA
ncbi:hypothetical protein M0R72_08950 [Candidatus Pacearchaeota archaeon]|jgi:hypothetical protein|nr:hypothetical protein [Candidatus Pacearchaeota archaeon]